MPTAPAVTSNSTDLIPTKSGVRSRAFREHRRRQLATRAGSKIDLPAAFRLRYENGLSYAKIGKLQGVTAAAVHAALKHFEGMVGDPATARTYREHEADILNGARQQLLANMLEPAKLAKADVGRLAFSFDKLFHAERLLRNQSTSNIGLRQAVVMEAHQQLPGPNRTANRTAQGKIASSS